MKSYTASELRQKSGSLIDTVLTDGSVQLIRHGRPVAYVISAKVAEELGLATPVAEDQAPAVRARRPVDENGDPYSATVREIADQIGTTTVAVNAIVSELIKDPEWGREKVIAVPSDQIGQTLIHKDAAILIARRAIARKSTKAPKEGA
jgi:prevent-host-death family protein